MKTIITSVKIPKSLELLLNIAVIDEGYGMRGKTRWVISAIDNFVKLPNYVELVDIANDIESLDTTMSIRINDEIIKALDNAVIDVRRHYPAMEGVQSNIIRASILQKLIRKKCSVTEQWDNYLFLFYLFIL